MRRFSRIGVVGVVLALSLALLASSATAKVLLVGTYKGIHGKYTTIQAAVNAAKPGDWILIGPGDYKTSSDKAPKGHADVPAGVLITKPSVFVRGMNRSKVIVDGTKPGTPVCSKKPRRRTSDRVNGGTIGLNGIEVWKADNVWVQNLTTCNFLGGSGDTGNEIWWNGGAGGGHIDGTDFVGSYLTATSTYFDKSERTDATYGIFTSDWSGGVFDHDYASNFNDSGFYIGGCNDAVQPDPREQPGRVQRDRLLGHQLGWLDADRAQHVRQQPGRLRHQRPEQQRLAVAAGRCLPRGRKAADRGRADLLDPLQERRLQQRQPERAGAGLRGRRPGRDRRLARGPQRHRHGQQLPSTTAPGASSSSPTRTRGPRRRT